MAALPTFLPVSEAARKYGLEEAHLRQLIEGVKSGLEWLRARWS